MDGEETIMSELKFKYKKPRCLYEDALCYETLYWKTEMGLNEFCIDDYTGCDCRFYKSVKEYEREQKGRISDNMQCIHIEWNMIVVGKSCKNYEFREDCEKGILKIGKKEFEVTELWIDGEKIFQEDEE